MSKIPCEIVLVKEYDFGDWLRENGLHVALIECIDARIVWIAKLYPPAEIMDGGRLVSCWQHGETKEIVVSSLRRRIEGERLAIEANTPRRRNITVPKRWSSAAIELEEI